MSTRMEQLLLALAATIAIPLGTALMTVNEDTLTHPGQWLRSLVIGTALAVGTGLYGWAKARRGETASG